MVGFIVLLVVLLLAIPVLAIIALVSTSGIRDSLHRLELRIAALENRPATPSPRPSPEPEKAQPAAPAPSITTEPVPPPPSPPPQPAAASVTSSPSPGSIARPVTEPTLDICFEERFGTRWVVWVGGIALALGGIFLVCATRSNSLIGPRARIALGALLALLLIAAGEWQRRSEKVLAQPSLPGANIPSILTAAGTTVAYATVYAAYALYGFLPPPIAFLLLGAIALLCLAAALLHGPVPVSA
jgi:uncharacterized membrane protein